MRLRALLAAGLAISAPLHADVIVLGNTVTGAIVIRGNLPNGSEASVAVHEAKAERETGWTQLFADDEKGWGAVVCVRHSGGVYFAQINGQASEGAAISGANAMAERFMAQNGGGIKDVKCAPRWNNAGQQISSTGVGVTGWTESRPEGVISKVRGAISKIGGFDYQRLCEPPRITPSAKAELRPIGSGTIAIQDKRPPTKAAPAWKPDPRCPKPNKGAGSIRG